MRSTSPDGLDQVEQLRAIRARVEELVDPPGRRVHQGHRARARRRPASSSSTGTTSTPTRSAQLTRVFEDRIFPVLTPLAVDPAHPFPYISNLSLNLAVRRARPRDRRGAVRAGEGAAAAPPLRRGARQRRASCPLEQVIAAHLDALFPGMEVLAHHPFRVTRDADIELSDESEDLLAAMEIVLRQRTKFGLAVRLEVDAHDDARGARAAVPRARARRERRVPGRRAARPQPASGTSTRSAGPS